MKEMIKNEILEYFSTTNNISEAIYIIDNIYIDGEFDYGCRGLDHNALLGDGYGWDDILEFGVVIVPETQTYISDTSVIDLDDLGYERLPLNDNHVVGFK